MVQGFKSSLHLAIQLPANGHTGGQQTMVQDMTSLSSDWAQVSSSHLWVLTWSNPGYCQHKKIFTWKTYVDSTGDRSSTYCLTKFFELLSLVRPKQLGTPSIPAPGVVGIQPCESLLLLILCTVRKLGSKAELALNPWPALGCHQQCPNTHPVCFQPSENLGFCFVFN